MKYLSWALAVFGLTVTIGLSAWAFQNPKILLGLCLLFYFPHPFEPDQ